MRVLILGSVLVLAFLIGWWFLAMLLYASPLKDLVAGQVAGEQLQGSWATTYESMKSMLLAAFNLTPLALIFLLLVLVLVEIWARRPESEEYGW